MLSASVGEKKRSPTASTQLLKEIDNNTKVFETFFD